MAGDVYGRPYWLRMGKKTYESMKIMTVIDT